MTRPGVLQQERDRQKHWADLGLPDPLTVLHEEETTRHLYGPDDHRHPAREALDAHFELHPEKRPSNWAHPYDWRNKNTTGGTPK